MHSEDRSDIHPGPRCSGGEHGASRQAKLLRHTLRVVAADDPCDVQQPADGHVFGPGLSHQAQQVAGHLGVLGELVDAFPGHRQDAARTVVKAETVEIFRKLEMSQSQQGPDLEGQVPTFFCVDRRGQSKSPPQALDGFFVTTHAHVVPAEKTEASARDQRICHLLLDLPLRLLD